MTQKEFSAIVSSIPAQPGIYKYYNACNELLYVGKAKHLRKRISSYFLNTFTNYKTHELVQRIHHIEFTIVNNEQDAFHLENSLIKEYQPKFNINLKDDKSYPYIIIKNEPFPRVFFTRKKVNDGSVYFGPYTSVKKVRELLDFIRQHILLRTCTLHLTDQNIRKGKFKVCLEYHLGNCRGPCEGLQSSTDYQQQLQQLANLLKGNLSSVIQYFKKEMRELSENMQFEKAEIYRKKIEHLQSYQSKSAVVGINTGTIDVFSILQDGNIAYVNYLAVNNGNIIHTKTVTLEKKLEEKADEVLRFAIADLRSTFNSEAKEIIVPFEIEYPEAGVKITVPKGGDRKTLLLLSEKNVNYFTEELHKKKMLNLEEKSAKEKLKILKEIQSYLHLPVLPVHIECFDNSNFQGSYPVSAMVYFKNGEPDKKEYRRFNIKTVTGINDFASMKEVIYRRYKRLTEENKSLPQLIIIDGGKGQLNAAVESIALLNLQNKINIIGLAKNEEEIFFPGDTSSIKLPWDSDSLKFIRSIRDEVHRFGIRFHRDKRSKGTFKNELEQIKGIGKTTAELLLKKFKSVKNIREKSEEEIASVIGKAKTIILATYFNNNNIAP